MLTNGENEIRFGDRPACLLITPCTPFPNVCTYSKSWEPFSVSNGLLPGCLYERVTSFSWSRRTYTDVSTITETSQFYFHEFNFDVVK